MRFIPPLMTQAADRGVRAQVLSFPIILNHKNRRFQFAGFIWCLLDPQRTTSLHCLILIGFPELILTISCILPKIGLHGVLKAE